jgi:hypothetical protein
VTFKVEPQALRTYAGQLEDARKATETAMTYVDRWGSLSAHEKGIFGMIFPQHVHFLAEVKTMLQSLQGLTGASSNALGQEASRYEQADSGAAGKIDASYPEVPRTTSRD